VANRPVVPLDVARPVERGAASETWKGTVPRCVSFSVKVARRLARARRPGTSAAAREV